MVESLIDAECQGALLGVVWHNRRMLLFSNAADPKRVRMTVRLSNDGAQTWPAARLLDPGPSAYSDLAITAEGSVLCLYECGEKGPYQRLRLVRFGIDWLRTAARPE